MRDRQEAMTNPHHHHDDPSNWPRWELAEHMEKDHGCRASTWPPEDDMYTIHREHHGGPSGIYRHPRPAKGGSI